MVKSASRPKKAKRLSFKKQLIFLCSCCATLFLLFLAGLNFDNYLQVQRVLGSQIQNLAEEKEVLNAQKLFWEQFLSENPTYLEGWISLAEINLELGESEEAKLSFSQAKSINPNSPKVKDFEERLNY
ncbi:MAG: hypothetical protein ACOYT7_01950 [Patescibacteria group bacterium]